MLGATSCARSVLLAACLALCFAETSHASQPTTQTLAFNGGNLDTSIAIPAYNPALDDNGFAGLQDIEVSISFTSARSYSATNQNPNNGCSVTFDGPLTNPTVNPAYACSVFAPGNNYLLGSTRIHYTPTTLHVEPAGTPGDTASGSATFHEDGQQFTTPDTGDFRGPGDIVLPVRFRGVWTENSGCGQAIVSTDNDVVAVITTAYH